MCKGPEVGRTWVTGGTRRKGDMAENSEQVGRWYQVKLGRWAEARSHRALGVTAKSFHFNLKGTESHSSGFVLPFQYILNVSSAPDTV